ncbi:MAG TPA: zinc-dependent peptidase [Gammaproteobacteria bacterium]|nr:zinc-dependent peptidase [Gammaproteobacteria bacterium]
MFRYHKGQRVTAGERERWWPVLNRFALARAWSAGRRDKLLACAAEFVEHKVVSGAAGFTPDAMTRDILALQAAVPILALGMNYYAGWVEVIVYPHAFVTTATQVDEAGVVHQARRGLSGESWERGPVVLSAEDVYQSACQVDGYNVVIHEMAHKLDALNGAMNGFPPLHRHMSRRAWTAAFEAAYADMAAAVERGDETMMDPYAVENPAEFFAVASEMFFERPGALKAGYSRVHEQLLAFYGYDPSPWTGNRRRRRSGRAIE